MKSNFTPVRTFLPPHFKQTLKHTYLHSTVLYICTLTRYTLHTSTTQPLDSSACRRGCRLAQIESLIVWPFNPQKETCTNSKFRFQVADASEHMHGDMLNKCLGRLHKGISRVADSLRMHMKACGASLDWNPAWSIPSVEVITKSGCAFTQCSFRINNHLDLSLHTHTACKEAYSSSSPSEQYACLVGCNATTITSVFADTRTNTGSMMDSLQGMLHLMVMSSTDQDSSSQQDMDILNQQAEILLPVSSSVSIVSKDVSVCHPGLFPSPLFLGLLPGFSVT